MVRKPRQGDILLLNTAPRSGHEQTGKRPYIVLSHDIIAEVLLQSFKSTIK
ncbi:PemK family protein [Enterococcus faecium]|nr:PemK family protein [Enterococcus faecium]SMJ99349.1 PemK family protein [Enterococcus faecium]